MHKPIVPPSLKEVWEWKQRVAEETSGMSSPEVIDYYKSRADSFLLRFGLDLPSRPASQARRSDAARDASGRSQA